MPDVSLDLQHIDYLSDKNVAVSAWRACVDALFVTSTGEASPFSCIVDTGAPFSVLPFSLWHGFDLHWTHRGRQLSRQGGRKIEPLKWQNADCFLGDTSVHLVDRKVQAGPFLVVAKFVSKRLPNPSLEMIAVLGMNFLTDNNLGLALNGAGGNLVGNLSVP